jgi:hypothetical protein
MFSRAERLLILIGCGKHFAKEPTFHIGRVYEWVQKHGLVIPAGEFLDQIDYRSLKDHQERRESRTHS